MIPPALDVDFSLSESTLHVTYSVLNSGNQSIFLFNVFWQFSLKGPPVPDQYPLYVSLEPEGLLKFGKMIHPTPRLKFVEMANIPMVSKVEPGKVWKESLTLPLPVQEHNPYYPAGPSSLWKDARSQFVEFWMSWMPHVSDLDVKPAPIEGALNVRHPQLLKLVNITKSPRIPLAVPVQRRVDTFERF
jgi:hypothetical protein